MDNKKIDSTIIIFTITVFTYGIVCLYEMGFKTFYNLPHKLIDVNPSIIAVITITLGSIGILGLIYNVFLNEETNLKASFKRLLKLDTRQRENERSLKWCSYIILVFLIPLCYFNVVRFDKFYSNGWYIVAIAGSLYTISKNYMKLFFCFAIIVIGLSIFKAGFGMASKKEDYLILKGTNLIVLDFKGDKAIVAKADFKKKLIYPEYQFIKLESAKPNEQQFELKHTGFMEMKR
ncbi:hypothetical protein ACQCWD_20645 [Bacillus thuringiensis]|uniref:Uncharacterized protein n=1 Tax=Bacillus cereus TaxID=1396 RepID=A0AAN6B5K3_BACCE|nr:hypothetical protein [Bacillus cereus]KAB2447013.1 hypothetical protein F8165_25925 [Bacillus cereus]KAB2486422.1 hypothetical protein F8157_13115 [Bacillus cereus]